MNYPDLRSLLSFCEKIIRIFEKIGTEKKIIRGKIIRKAHQATQVASINGNFSLKLNKLKQVV